MPCPQPVFYKITQSDGFLIRLEKKLSFLDGPRARTRLRLFFLVRRGTPTPIYSYPVVIKPLEMVIPTPLQA